MEVVDRLGEAQRGKVQAQTFALEKERRCEELIKSCATDVSVLLKPRKDKKKEIEEVLGLKLDELKGKYQVDTDELYQEAVQAKKYFVELKKTKKSEKKPKTAEEKKKGQKGKKGKEGVTRRRGRGPPTKYTTKKRRETKKVFDYSAEIGDKDKFVKDEIKNMIRELNVSTRCNYCGSGKASIQHVLAGCKMALYFGFYSRRHDRVLHIIRNAFEDGNKILQSNSSEYRWVEESSPGRMTLTSRSLIAGTGLKSPSAVEE
ncbi:uncharacterized protein LOC108253311 [Diaphorina citri]|uniref:Uncharacterized protein LOC108253311 n=1 Tax=Diaphorina citri TaxID=121845 RepID=A0A1S4EK95_DIACI|nr:uncharacterized protein LOC108253311 [Diaphorina citri]